MAGNAMAEQPPRPLSLSPPRETPAARSHHSWLAPPHPEKMRTKEGKLDAEEVREGGRVGARKRWARVGVAKMAAFCSSPGLCLCLWGDCSCSVVNGIFASLRWGLELEVAKEWDLAFLVPRQGQRSGGIVVVRAVSACVLPKLPRRRGSHTVNCFLPRCPFTKWGNTGSFYWCLPARARRGFQDCGLSTCAPAEFTFYSFDKGGKTGTGESDDFRLLCEAQCLWKGKVMS